MIGFLCIYFVWCIWSIIAKWYVYTNRNKKEFYFRPFAHHHFPPMDSPPVYGYKLNATNIFNIDTFQHKYRCYNTFVGSKWYFVGRVKRNFFFLCVVPNLCFFLFSFISRSIFFCVGRLAARFYIYIVITM